MLLPVLLWILFMGTVSAYIPTDRAAMWRSEMHVSHPELLSVIDKTIKSEVKAAEKEHFNWLPSMHANGQPHRPQSDDLVSLSIGLHHTADRQRAIELLFALIAHPDNVRPSFAMSLAQFHAHALSAAILDSHSATSDLRIMNSLTPQYFPRFYGEHLTKAETDALLRPTEENVNAVKEWIATAFTAPHHAAYGKTSSVLTDAACDVSSANDYFQCELTLAEYTQLFPFADVRLYQHRQEEGVTIVKVFPNDMAAMMKHTTAMNGKVHAVLQYNAIQFIGGSNVWPMSSPPRKGFGKKNSLVASTSQSTPMTPTFLSSEDFFFEMFGGSTWLAGFVEQACPDNYTLESRTCNDGGAAYLFSELVITAKYQVKRNTTGAVATMQVTQHFPNPEPKYKIHHDDDNGSIQFNITLPYNYVQVKLEATQVWTNVLTGQPKEKTFSSARPAAPSQQLQVALVKTLYRWNSNLVNKPSTSYQPQAVFAPVIDRFENGLFNYDDLAAFFLVNGLAKDQSAAKSMADLATKHWGHIYLQGYYSVDIETQLDTQWMMGIAPHIPTIVYRYDWTQSSALLMTLQSMQNTSDEALPTVLSISYGFPESMTGPGSVFPGFYGFVDTALQALGLRGVSVFVSSGDSGAWETFNNANPLTFNYQTAGMTVSWPASSPFVTAVGGTQLMADAVTENADGSVSFCPTEVVQSLAGATFITSGGGFSNQYPMPMWQQPLVGNYVQTCPMPSLPFNSTQRAIPDISLLGHNYQVINQGESISVDGTSASSPAFAGFISNINQIRKAHGLRALGFLNPLLYKIAAEHPEAFNDVTRGDNSCAEVDWNVHTRCFPTGYQACSGYDAATGLGTPRWDVLAPLLSPELPASIFAFSENPGLIDGCVPQFPSKPPVVSGAADSGPLRTTVTAALAVNLSMLVLHHLQLLSKW